MSWVTGSVRAAWENSSPSRNILLFRTMGQRQHKHPLRPPSVSFQSFKDLSNARRPVSGIKRYSRAEATPLHSHHHSDESSCSVQGQTVGNPSQWWEGYVERGRVDVSISSSVSFLQIRPFISPDLRPVRSSPRRRPYFSRKQTVATDERIGREE